MPQQNAANITPHAVHIPDRRSGNRHKTTPSPEYRAIANRHSRNLLEGVEGIGVFDQIIVFALAQQQRCQRIIPTGSDFVAEARQHPLDLGECAPRR
jgi:hypothetical protein